MHQPRMAEAWAALDSDKRNELLEAADKLGAHITLKALHRAQILPAQPRQPDSLPGSTARTDHLASQQVLFPWPVHMVLSICDNQAPAN